MDDEEANTGQLHWDFNALDKPDIKAVEQKIRGMVTLYFEARRISEQPRMPDHWVLKYRPLNRRKTLEIHLVTKWLLWEEAELSLLYNKNCSRAELEVRVGNRYPPF